VLLRAAELPGEPERCAAGPGLLARSFGIDRGQDGAPVDAGRGLWLSPRPPALELAPADLVQTVRIGVSQGREIPWRWYLRRSRAVSRRAPGDPPPPRRLG
jgi:DNA-3-methyladenine glycosylase